MQIGKTKVFLRTGQLAILEGIRGQILSEFVILIQSNFRMYLQRKSFTEKVQAATKIQAAWRAHREVVDARMRLETASAILIQSSWRGFVERSEFLGHLRFVHRKKICISLPLVIGGQCLY